MQWIIFGNSACASQDYDVSLIGAAEKFVLELEGFPAVGVVAAPIEIGPVDVDERAWELILRLEQHLDLGPEDPATARALIRNVHVDANLRTQLSIYVLLEDLELEPEELDAMQELIGDERVDPNWQAELIIIILDDEEIELKPEKLAIAHALSREGIVSRELRAQLADLLAEI